VVNAIYTVGMDLVGFSVIDSFDQAEIDDREYWHARTPAERMNHLSRLRRINYGTDRVSARLRRILEVVDRTPG
jgi:hypothetical protein